MEMTDELLTTNEVSRRLKVSREKLRRWRREGDGPPFLKVGPRTVRYRASEVERFLTGCQEAA